MSTALETTMLGIGETAKLYQLVDTWRACAAAWRLRDKTAMRSGCLTIADGYERRADELEALLPPRDGGAAQDAGGPAAGGGE